VRIESGAKSALDPTEPTIIRPYVSDDLPGLDLAVSEVTTIKAARTFWDKVVIAHGLRRWYDRRGVLRQEGQRISRHYYDLHCLARSNAGEQAMADRAVGENCVSHARMFFDRADYDLASAVPGSYALTPHDTMIDALRRDYDNTRTMIFGDPPTFADILVSVAEIEGRINADAASDA
jgi:Nucleotidyl transferase AbiEii toxin, Type IV TA system